MSKSLLTVTLLLSAWVFPLSAHADAIDDFVLTGNGTTITFSLPASPPGNMDTCPTGVVTSCLPGSETAFTVATLVTTGSGAPVEEDVTFPTFRFGGGLSVDALTFRGNQALFSPDAANPTFLLGTFDLSMLNPSGDPPFLDYSITISADPSTASAPEPSSVILLGTGIFGLIGLASIKRGQKHGSRAI